MARTDTQNAEISAHISSEGNISLINKTGCSHFLPQQCPHMLSATLLTSSSHSSTHREVGADRHSRHFALTSHPFPLRAGGQPEISQEGCIAVRHCSYGWEQCSNSSTESARRSDYHFPPFTQSLKDIDQRHVKSHF